MKRKRHAQQAAVVKSAEGGLFLDERTLFFAAAHKKIAMMLTTVPKAKALMNPGASLFVWTIVSAIEVLPSDI